MNKCEDCGFLHYRTDPCRVAKKSTAALKAEVQRSGTAERSQVTGPVVVSSRSRALPVDTNPGSSMGTLDSSTQTASSTPSAGTGGDTDRQPKPRGRPRIHPDRKIAKAMYERNRRARMKLGTGN